MKSHNKAVFATILAIIHRIALRSGFQLDQREAGYWREATNFCQARIYVELQFVARHELLAALSLKRAVL